MEVPSDKYLGRDNGGVGPFSKDGGRIRGRYPSNIVDQSLRGPWIRNHQQHEPLLSSFFPRKQSKKIYTLRKERRESGLASGWGYLSRACEGS